jgi:hypothetical protein
LTAKHFPEDFIVEVMEENEAKAKIAMFSITHLVLNISEDIPLDQFQIV